MIGQTMREYGGRFLFELIQNGYDAQPSGAESGRIAIVLADDEGLTGRCMSLTPGMDSRRAMLAVFARLG